MTPAERANLVRWRALLPREIAPSDAYAKLFKLVEPLLRATPGRVLTLDEVRALRSNTILRITWGGGNGPHLYQALREHDIVWVTTLHSPWLELKDPLIVPNPRQIVLLDHVEQLEF